MEKKKYMKPAMQVYELPGRPMIICYSGGDFAHIPGINDDEKHLA
jgi:hypothetical protein